MHELYRYTHIYTCVSVLYKCIAGQDVKGQPIDRTHSIYCENTFYICGCASVLQVRMSTKGESYEENTFHIERTYSIPST